MKTLFKVILGLKERGLIPDFYMRLMLRWMCWMWARRLSCYGDVEKQMQYKMSYVNKLKVAEGAIKQNEANEQHYEVPTTFFQTCLGPWMKYSCGLWESQTRTLQQSEEAMMKLACDRARISDGGLRVLDLGCGWGSMALFIAKQFPTNRVTALSNSRTQREFILQRAKDMGLTNVEVITADASVFEFPESPDFDRIVSNEMLEHMKNYETTFKKIASWLKPDGILFIHVLGNRRFAYSFNGGSDDWMGKYFFAGGTMPSEDLFSFFMPSSLKIENMWRVSGVHYQKTLNAWLRRLDTKENTRAALKALEGDATKNARLALGRWRIFFLFCAEVFGFNNGSDWLVLHYCYRRRSLECGAVTSNSRDVAPSPSTELHH